MNPPSDAAAADDEVFVFPASFAQQRLWFLDQVDPGTAVYNVPQAFWLEGALDVPALQRACDEVVRRHEALRTTFTSRDGAPLQVVAREGALPLAITDLRERPGSAAEREAEALRLAAAAAREPFALDRGPLVRAALVVLGLERHLLVLNVHHSVCDGFSLALLLRELSQLYPAFHANRPSPLPEPTLQYADYALWQREWFQGDELERQLGHARKALVGELPVLELPGDRRRPPLASFRGGSLRFPVSRALTDALAEVSRREGASSFMTLLAAWQVLLYRLAGQEDILVGTPIANRDRAEIETSIGFYTNTVVFRSDLGGAPGFTTLLRRLREGAMAVFAHQDLPLEKIVEAVHPARATGANPIFQVMFGMQKAPEDALALPGLRAVPVAVHSGTSKFDLTLDMQEIASGMQGFLEYSSDLFDDDSAARIARHFHTLLQGIAAAPDTPITQLPLLDAAERRQILIDFNAAGARALDVAPGTTIHALVAAQAAATPDAVAFEHGDARLSYRELERRADTLAAHLCDLGVGPDVLVGVFLERSLDVPVALLAILKAGGAYLPLDPAYPPQRIAYMLEDAATPVVVTQADLSADLPSSLPGLRVVCIDREPAPVAAPARAARPAGPDDLAYVIYTSGSTGRPKGVEIPHGAVVNFLASMRGEPGLAPADRLLAVTTLSFDIAGLELFLPLTVGATAILASRDEAADGALLLEKLQSTRATVMQATPATWRLLLDAGWQAGPENAPPLKVLCGGEALAPDLAAAILERTPELWNMYGPTETTIWSTCTRVSDPDAIVIGGPIARTQLYVLDGSMAPVPLGTAGELYIGGAGLARGYRGRPELTAERFVPDPFGPPGARLYRTGDRARFRPGGALEHLGRLDGQVKVRGFRIELGEIEAALGQHPAVRQAVVVVKDDGAKDKRLCAYLVFAGETATPSELRKFLRRSLPDYMVPHLFVDLPALPLTANGKIDRARLPDPFGQAAAVSPGEKLPPQTATEEIIAGIWREALKVELVGRHDNFFDAGGHSLLSMQVIHRIQQRVGHRLNPRSLVFQNLEQLAAECEAAAGAGGQT